MAGKVYDKSINGKVERTISSADGLAQAALTENGELFYITADKCASVATGVCQFTLSADGTRVAYMVESDPDASDTSDSSTEKETTQVRRSLQEEETTESTTEYVPAGAESYLKFSNTSLFLYNGSSANSTLIANHVSPESVSLSPTGAVIAYSVTAEDETSFEGFYALNSVKTSIGRNALPIAVSDDALQYYFVKYDNIEDVWVQKLFVKAGENAEVKLGEFADGNLLSLYLNRDYSQAIYSVTGKKGSYFFYSTDHDKEKVSSGYVPIYAYGLREVMSGKAVITPLETFAKTCFRDASSTAQYLDGKYICKNTGALGNAFRVSPDGKTMYYLDTEGDLYSCVLRKLDKKKIAEHVMTFELSADGSVVYYVNADNKLYCVKGSKVTPAAENVYTSGGSGLVVTDAGYLYFLQNYAYGNGTLCYLKGDGKARSIDSIKNVHDLAADVGEYIYYRSDYSAITGTYNLFYGRGKKYTKILEKLG